MRSTTPAGASRLLTGRSLTACAAKPAAPLGLTEVGLGVGDQCLRGSSPTSRPKRPGTAGPSQHTPYDGMLFVYDGPSDSAFTMSGVPVPLDIGFYRGDGEPVSRRRMEPCPADEVDCPAYSSVARTCALETEAGALVSGAHSAHALVTVTPRGTLRLDRSRRTITGNLARSLHPTTCTPAPAAGWFRCRGRPPAGPAVRRRYRPMRPYGHGHLRRGPGRGDDPVRRRPLHPADRGPGRWPGRSTSGASGGSPTSSGTAGEAITSSSRRRPSPGDGRVAPGALLADEVLRHRS